MTGRPSEYTPEVADAICERVALGDSMRKIATDDGMPAMSTMFKWLRQFPGFTEQYTRAKEQAAEVMAEDIITIADDGSDDYITKTRMDGSEYEEVDQEHIQRSRLRVEARKWIAAKLKPKKYGDAHKVEHSGTVSLEQILGAVDKPTDGPR